MSNSDDDNNDGIVVAVVVVVVAVVDGDGDDGDDDDGIVVAVVVINIAEAAVFPTFFLSAMLYLKPFLLLKPGCCPSQLTTQVQEQTLSLILFC